MGVELAFAAVILLSGMNTGHAVESTPSPSSASSHSNDSTTNDVSFDINAPCRDLLSRFALALHDVIHCATNHSSPPVFCTACHAHYLRFHRVEQDLTLENSTSLSNQSCVSVLTGGTYPVSFDWLLRDVIHDKFWRGAPQCAQCWTCEKGTCTYRESTTQFMTKKLAWESCVNATRLSGNASAVCDACASQYNELFEFYWKVTVDGLDDESKGFCLDVDTMMNDTVQWWELWQCEPHHPSPPPMIIAFSAVFLATITILFYAGSYIQVDRAQLNLIQYSRLDPPRGMRSRILGSSSALADDFDASPSSSSANSHSSNAPPGQARVLVAASGYGVIS